VNIEPKQPTGQSTCVHAQDGQPSRRERKEPRRKLIHLLGRYPLEEVDDDCTRPGLGLRSSACGRGNLNSIRRDTVLWLYAFHVPSLVQLAVQSSLALSSQALYLVKSGSIAYGPAQLILYLCALPGPELNGTEHSGPQLSALHHAVDYATSKVRVMCLHAKPNHDQDQHLH
jgi:hypothetical protein